MPDFPQEQGEQTAYQAFLMHKIDRARASIEAGEVFSGEDVEADFAARRAAAARQWRPGR